MNNITTEIIGCTKSKHIDLTYGKRFNLPDIEYFEARIDELLIENNWEDTLENRLKILEKYCLEINNEIDDGLLENRRFKEFYCRYLPLVHHVSKSEDWLGDVYLELNNKDWKRLETLRSKRGTLKSHIRSYFWGMIKNIVSTGRTKENGNPREVSITDTTLLNSKTVKFDDEFGMSKDLELFHARFKKAFEALDFIKHGDDRFFYKISCLLWSNNEHHLKDFLDTFQIDKRLSLVLNRILDDIQSFGALDSKDASFKRLKQYYIWLLDIIDGRKYEKGDFQRKWRSDLEFLMNRVFVGYPIFIKHLELSSNRERALKFFLNYYLPPFGLRQGSR